MALLHSAFITIVAKPAAKLLFKTAFGETLLNDMSGELVDKVNELFPGQENSAEISARFETLARKVADELWPLLERENDTCDTEPVAKEVASLLDHIVNTRLLLQANLDPRKLYHELQTFSPRPVGFSDDEIVLYHRILKELAIQLVTLAPQWKDFSYEYPTEVLSRLDVIIDLLKTLQQRPEIEYARYESAYLNAVRHTFDYIELFGAGLRPGEDNQPLLSVAYISVSVKESKNSEGKIMDAGRMLETLATTSGRVLITGEAGGGKSTLTRWIAMECARHQLGLPTQHYPQLEQREKALRTSEEDINGSNLDAMALPKWRDRIPFLIRLRGLKKHNYTLPPLDDIPLVGIPQESNPPVGWMKSVIEAGRAIFLIDGIDEVPDDRRAELRISLDNYFLHQSAYFVLTSRPSATRTWETWRLQRQVGQVHINDLSYTESHQLVYSWHEALRRNLKHGNNSTERLDGIEQALIKKVESRDSLARLMVNPLLCSMICALHYWQNRQIPEHFVELCEDLCKVLIHERARLSGVPEKEFHDCYAKLDYTAKRLLVQSIAVDMVMPQWTSEISWTRAKTIIEKGIVNRPNLDISDAPLLLNTLIERSGVLREREGISEAPHSSVLEFIHNTFKEHLAADWLLKKAPQSLFDHLEDPNWENIVLFGAGNGTDEDAALQVMRQLVASQRESSHILALKCRAVAQFTDAQLDLQLAQLRSKFFPPNSEEKARLVAGLGDEAVKDLLYREGLTTEQTKACVIALGRINTAKSRDGAKSYFEDERVFDELVRLFNPLEIPKIRQRFINFKDVPRGWRLQVNDLEPIQHFTQLQTLDLDNTQVSDLTPLQYFTQLQSLDLDSTQVSDLTPLKNLYQLQELYLRNTRVNNIEPIQNFNQLQILALDNTPVSDLTPLKNLHQLQALFLRNTQASNLKPLQGLKNLRIYIGKGMIRASEL